MNWLKIFKPNIGAGTYTPSPSPIPHPDLDKELKTGGRCISSYLPSPPPPLKKEPKGRLVPLSDGRYTVQIWQEEYKKFTLIDVTNDIEDGKQKIKDYFKEKDFVINGTINVY